MNKRDTSNTYHYGYGDLEDRLISLFLSGPPDFQAADELISSGANVNAIGSDKDSNILSEILRNYWEVDRPEYCEEEDSTIDINIAEFDRGDSMVSIIRYFLKKGFDLSLNNDRFGAQCLVAIAYSAEDGRTIEALKILLDAGAKNIPESEDYNDSETPWDAFGTEGSFQDICCQDHHLGNVYEAAYQIFQAIEDGRPYSGIDTYEKAIGRTIRKVKAAKPQNESVFYDLNLPESTHKNCYNSTLYFILDEGVLISTQYADFWTDTIVPDESLVDVSSCFSGIIGAAILHFSFDHHEVKKGGTGYGQPITTLTMDNGLKIRFTINFGEVEDENRAAYYSIIIE